MREQPAAARPWWSLRAWEDVPLARKFGLLLTLTAVSGWGMGVAQASLNQLWPAVLGIGVLLLVITGLAHRWIWQPHELLVRQVEALRLRRRAAALRHLPVDRGDEIGQMARSIQEIGLMAIQSMAEVRQLRRTLDHRIATATRVACGQLEQLAMRDPLTDLANRRFLDEQLRPLLVTAGRNGEEFACVLIDLDNFKRVNDTLGHAAGDELLIFVAGLIRAVIRREDYAVRLGGDEFAVFMPGCPPHRALAMAEQLTALFRQQMRTTMPAELGCDLSIGIASLQSDVIATGQNLPDNPDQALIELADRRLYDAKHQGKGRIVSM